MLTKTLSRKGFSLIELLAVMAIMGSFTVILIGGSGTMSDTAANRSAVSQLASGLDRARAHAISSGGFAAFVVAGPDAGDMAWRKYAVFTVVEDPAAAAGTIPFKLPVDPTEPVLSWAELPGSQIVFGTIHDSNVASMVDSPEFISVPHLNNSPNLNAKTIIFNNQGAVVYPTVKANRVIRVGNGSLNGDSVKLMRPELAENQSVISVERFTGRIRIVR